ncbi:unnamed protein product [Brachionus calyciflorus]|uniref:Uncharacterized protein n=1 Tax=Brachionus calyciflorus TaxID=104777 RepID=A0A813USA9_9BILA|nr:unnamed protein product [Brachionus calyciflorus]
MYQISKSNLNFDFESNNLIGKQFEIKYLIIDLSSKEAFSRKYSLNNPSVLNESSNNSYVKDVEYTLVKRNIKEWLDEQNNDLKKFLKNLNSACSSNSACYLLPLNFEILKKLNSLDYLTYYSRINSFRLKTVNLLFNKHKTDDMNYGEDPFVLRTDLIRALREFHGEEINTLQANNMLDFLGLNKTKEVKILDRKTGDLKPETVFIFDNFNLKQFRGLMVFSERYFIKSLKILQSAEFIPKNILEYLDFRYLLSKLDSMNIDQNLKDLLKFISETN